MFGFLAHSFPSHIALTIHQVPAFDIAFSVDDLFMELAKAVHALVVMLPPSLVEEMEREELQCEPNGVCVCVCVCVCVWYTPVDETG